MVAVGVEDQREPRALTVGAARDAPQAVARLDDDDAAAAGGQQGGTAHGRQHMAALLQAKALTDAKAVEAATERLAQVTEPFAARRMNKGIQSALAGQNIESI